jgi:protoporphyrinogen oxidase
MGGDVPTISGPSAIPAARLNGRPGAAASDQRPALTILGGGPAGLALAYYANRAGIPFTLFERSEALGGLCRTFEHAGHRYDSGAHRFHDRDPEVTADVRQLMGDELIAVDAPSKIYDRGRFIDFPPTPLNLISSGLRLREAVSIGLDVVRSRRKRRPLVSFADFAIAQFGEILARRILLDYSEKLWGLPADQLSPDVATRRLHGMTLSSLMLEFFLPSRKTAHIDGSFLYPRRGYGAIVERLEEALPAGSIRRGCEINGLDCDGGRIRRIRFSDAAPFAPGDRVVSTLPLTLLARLLGDTLPERARAAAAGLRFRQIRLFFIRLNRAQVSSSASLYIPDPRWCVSRLYEPKNRSRAMAPERETALVVEVPGFANDPIHSMRDEDLARRVIDELGQIGIIDPAEVIDWRHHLLRNAYPVYSLNYADALREIREALAPIQNLDLIGRGGRFFYSHLHDQMRFGTDYVSALMSSDPARHRAP